MEQKLYMVEFMQDGIKPTDAQNTRLSELAKSWRGVQVYHRAYGLPEGYLSITLDPNGQPVYGGMDAEGIVST